ncbi:NucA/NucB deoxyribonuclease domain-containing protein [Streptomyces sp. NPDC058603]|uniref:NucA/NucB deoxyribonuclease domain-containing protein n=1 Tax=Streptomyces sp. NPDC058603 TaxID=3346551 RepID=UPI0036503FDB
MTAAECQKGLGSDKAFYIKSRFAVCSGALFQQVWTQRGRPVGESRFVVLAIGTIALDSREVRFTHHFTSMEKTGSTKTGALMITPKTAVPFMAPKKAKYTLGGSVPGTRSWDKVKADKPFPRTMTVAPGQGSSGSTDLVASAYVVSIDLKFPTGVNGATGGDLFLLPPRWDAAKYLRNSTGGGKPDKRGAATFAVVATLNYSAKAGAPERAVAQHIRTAFTKPEDTKPYMSAKKVPGQVPSIALNRLYADKKRQDENRRKAVAQCKRHYGKDYAKTGKECDEYPFASTHQGAAEVDYDPDAKKFNFSVKAISKDENKAGGDLLKGFYGKNRVLDGFEDKFIVKITS